jgi:uncharacterized protein YecE (DUF72 family)
MGRLYAGTSGFAYASWKPAFYPDKLPSAKFLDHYAARLNSVEINYTFRRLASVSTLSKWVESTPAGFVFACKAHMRITHILRLRNASEFLELFFKSIEPLRSARRLGPVLFQLPPAMRADAALLGDFLALLPGDLRFTFEFRHASWFTEPVYELLRRRNASLCAAESDRLETPEVVTADFVYSRLRKASYSAEERAAIAARSREVVAGGRDLYVYFKHEDTADGALYAEELLKTGTG